LTSLRGSPFFPKTHPFFLYLPPFLWQQKIRAIARSRGQRKKIFLRVSLPCISVPRYRRISPPSVYSIVCIGNHFTRFPRLFPPFLTPPFWLGNRLTFFINSPSPPFFFHRPVSQLVAAFLSFFKGPIPSVEVR